MDTVTPARRSANMARIRSRDTKPELVVRHFLHAQGLRFRLHKKGLPGKPDIVLARRRSVVFVHGCFWHGCPHCRAGRRKVLSNVDYWTAKLARNRDRDARTAAELTAAGWRVLTVWECETRNPATLEALAATLKDQPSSGGSPCTASGPGPS